MYPQRATYQLIFFVEHTIYCTQKKLKPRQVHPTERRKAPIMAMGVASGGPSKSPNSKSRARQPGRTAATQANVSDFMENVLKKIVCWQNSKFGGVLINGSTGIYIHHCSYSV